MKTMKIMGIIGIVWFGLWMMTTFGASAYYSNENQDVAVGSAFLMFIYGIAYSIVGVTMKYKNEK